MNGGCLDLGIHLIPLYDIVSSLSLSLSLCFFVDWLSDDFYVMNV